MKAWRFLLTAVMCVASLSLVSGSVENPGLRNPAGYGTIPPSNYRSGLVNTPNPIDTTGNLLMTGNVRRGMHFRGSVPYRSTTSFNAKLGSSALNSFLRDTAGSEDFGGLANKYRVQPFYSPTQTVSTMMPGRSEVFNPMDMRIDNRVRQGSSFVGDGLLGLDSLPREQISQDQDAATSSTDFQKLQNRYPSTSPRVPFDSDQGEGASYPAESRYGRSQGTRQRDQSLDFVQDDDSIEPLVPGQLGIRRARDVSAERSAARAGDLSPYPSRQENLPAKEDLTQYPGEEMSRENLESRLEVFNPGGSVDAERSITAPSGLGTPDQATPPTPVEDLRHKTEVPSPDDSERSEIFEQIRKQLDALTKSVEAGLQENAGSKLETRNSMLDASSSLSMKGKVPSSTLSGIEPENPESLDSRLSAGIKSHTSAPLKFPESVGEVGLLSLGVEGVPPSNRGQDARDTELKGRVNPRLSAHTEQIKGPYESLESFSLSRFNLHVSAAEDHLKAGRYYRAVDSFTLASVYQPNNLVVLAGKGHALFAAGEYMSSALFLARALTVRPDYTQTKVDLAILLGGAEKLTERITDVEQWLARSGSAQLQFLLSYVYFRMGRLNPAKQAIVAAYEKIPDSPAVVTMRTAINQAAK